MALKAHPGIGFGHTFSVVDHLHQRSAGVAHHKLHRFCFRIHGILQQLFNDRSRPLHHLTSRNLVGNRIGQKLDDILHKKSTGKAHKKSRNALLILPVWRTFFQESGHAFACIGGLLYLCKLIVQISLLPTLRYVFKFLKRLQAKP